MGCRVDSQHGPPSRCIDRQPKQNGRDHDAGACAVKTIPRHAAESATDRNGQFLEPGHPLRECPRLSRVTANPSHAKCECKLALRGACLEMGSRVPSRVVRYGMGDIGAWPSGHAGRCTILAGPTGQPPRSGYDPSSLAQVQRAHLSRCAN